jgi:phosphate transport system protein
MALNLPAWRRQDDDGPGGHLPGLSGPPSVLEEVDAILRRVFALVGEGIAGATHALLTGDREAAKRLVAQDEVIDELILELHGLVEKGLIEAGRSAVERQQLISTLRMLPDLERNGDLAEHIARRAARGLGQEMNARSRGLVERMGEVAAAMWRHTAEVIEDPSGSAAAAVEDLDDELDDLHVTLTAELVSGSSPLPVAIEIAMVARFYERFGDHAVNLARRISMFLGAPVHLPPAGAD